MRRISPRGLELILLVGIVSVGGYALRHQPPLALNQQSSSSSIAFPAYDESPSIDVNVTPRSSDDWIIELEGDYVCRNRADGRILARGSGLRPTRIHRGTNRWDLTPVLQECDLTAGSVEIDVPNGETFRLGRRRYRGSLILTTMRGGRPILVNRVGLEDYVASVVDGEMPLEFGREARCAQAIIARSYVLYQRQRSRRAGLPYDVHGDTRSQYYPGYQYQDRKGAWYSGESCEGRECAKLTCGLVCAEEDRPICTYYSAVCGGKTCVGWELFPDASPLLKSVNCDHCRAAPLYRWEKTLPLARFQSGVQRYLKGKGSGSLNWKTWGIAGNETDLPRFRVSDKRDSFFVSGLELRKLWGGDLLPSPNVTVEFLKDRVIFRGAGHGHGVGLCQWGARGLAAEGKDFREILNFYYPGVRIVAYGELKVESTLMSETDPARNGSHVKRPR